MKHQPVPVFPSGHEALEAARSDYPARLNTMAAVVRICVGWLILLAGFAPARAQSVAAPEPNDVVLELRCPNSPCRFRQGEVIQLRLNFTASVAAYSAQDAVEAGGNLSTRAWGRESFKATPSECVGDPLEGTSLMNPSGIFGTVRLLPGKPYPVLVELNQWIRLGCPGKYQVTARSTRVYRGGDPALAFQQQHTIVSTPLEIETIPADPEWQRGELARILPELPAPGAAYSAQAKAAVRAVAYLGSDDAFREIRKHVSEAPLTADFMLKNSSYVFEWEMARRELLRRAASPPYR